MLEEMANVLAITPIELNKFIASAPHRYKVYPIAKRNKSSIRMIAQPARELKYLQKLALESFFQDLPIHASSTAYRKGKSIYDNASCHAGSAFFFKTDFKDFFPSIKPVHFLNCIRMARGLPLSKVDASFVSNLFFYRMKKKSALQLSIGAPSSPFISNAVMYSFDEKVSEVAVKNKVNYTRYADDLMLSSRSKESVHATATALQIIKDNSIMNSLVFNAAKTHFLSKKDNVHITGMVLTPQGRVSIGRKNKRKVKSLVHRWTLHQLNESEVSYLKGYLSFCYAVEPGFCQSLKVKYGETLNHLF
jgi:hypothetical protein